MLMSRTKAWNEKKKINRFVQHRNILSLIFVALPIYLLTLHMVFSIISFFVVRTRFERIANMHNQNNKVLSKKCTGFSVKRNKNTFMPNTTIATSAKTFWYFISFWFFIHFSFAEKTFPIEFIQYTLFHIEFFAGKKILIESLTFCKTTFAIKDILDVFVLDLKWMNAVRDQFFPGNYFISQISVYTSDNMIFVYSTWIKYCVHLVEISHDFVALNLIYAIW